MSDTFDHEGDAWDSFDQSLDDDSENIWYRYGGWSGHSFSTYDKDYYHKKRKFKSIIRETEKAYFIDVDGILRIWVAKKLVRELHIRSDKPNYMVVHARIFDSILNQTRADNDSALDF